MAIDSRVRYTKMIIRKSIFELLQDKPFHSITLTEVCKKAEINRTTFYNYYKDMYAWKEQLEQECLQRTKDTLEQYTIEHIQDILTQQFNYMREHAELYRLLASPNFESNILEQICALILDKADAEAKKQAPPKQGTAFQQKLDYHYTIFGYLGILVCWMNNGMQEEPDILAAYYTKHIHSLLFQKSNP